MVELDDAVRRHQRVVIRQRHHAGAEADLPGALRRRGDEDLGRGDDLEAGRVMLADPGFLVAEPVQILDQFEVADAELRGSSSSGWNGARKMPLRIGIERVIRRVPPSGFTSSRISHIERRQPAHRVGGFLVAHHDPCLYYQMRRAPSVS